MRAAQEPAGTRVRWSPHAPVSCPVGWTFVCRMFLSRMCMITASGENQVKPIVQKSMSSPQFLSEVAGIAMPSSGVRHACAMCPPSGHFVGLRPREWSSCTPGPHRPSETPTARACTTGKRSAPALTFSSVQHDVYLSWNPPQRRPVGKPHSMQQCLYFQVL